MKLWTERGRPLLSVVWIEYLKLRPLRGKDRLPVTDMEF
jgi:hypothetical protein